MVKEFQNKNYWAIVLGGSSGLGLASAAKLATQGFNVCIIHRDSRARKDTIEKSFDRIRKEGIDFMSFNADALNTERRNGIIEELKHALGNKGRVRALIHSIAKGNLKPMISESSPVLQHEDFIMTTEAMAISLYDWTKALYEAALFSDDARIISFTSEGNKKAWKNYAAVSAAKVTLEAITRSIALEFAPHGIRANCIQAGVTETLSFRMIPGSDKIREFTMMRNPFGRLTTPEDVANAVYLLCKDEAAWINGSVIPVDGGEHLS
jgi:enoyl-[acyl-carrier protein] reductase I